MGFFGELLEAVTEGVVEGLQESAEEANQAARTDGIFAGSKPASAVLKASAGMGTDVSDASYFETANTLEECVENLISQSSDLGVTLTNQRWIDEAFYVNASVEIGGKARAFGVQCARQGSLYMVGLYKNLFSDAMSMQAEGALTMLWNLNKDLSGFGRFYLEKDMDKLSYDNSLLVSGSQMECSVVWANFVTGVSFVDVIIADLTDGKGDWWGE